MAARRGLRVRFWLGALVVVAFAAVACQQGQTSAPDEGPPAEVAGRTTVQQQPPAAAPELVPNGGMEELDPQSRDRPSGWEQISWGDNARLFGLTSAGAHSGRTAARVEITRWSSGADTWAFSPVPVRGGTRYEVNTWYRSSVPVELLAVERDASGRESYPYRRVLGPTADWAEASARFATSPTAAEVTVYQSITSVGWVEVDDVSLRENTSAELARPIVSLTFDDGSLSHHDVVLPTLRKAGLVGTFYLTTDYLDAKGDPPFMTTKMAEDLVDAGMEIGGHTATHPHLSELKDDEVRKEVLDSKRELERRLHVHIEDFASPFGDTNRSVRRRIMSAYASHRTTSDGTNRRDDIDMSQLHAWLVERTMTVSTILGWLEQARDERSWLIIVFHDIDPNPTQYGTTPRRFQQMIDTIANSGLAVETVAEARAEITPQLAG